MTFYFVCHGGLASLSPTSTAKLNYSPGQRLSTFLPAATLSTLALKMLAAGAPHAKTQKEYRMYLKAREERPV